MFKECCLEALNISKDFPGVKALSDVSINIKHGEIHGLIGENGAGKSTLLKILNGWYPFGAYEGIIKVKDAEQQFHSPHDAHNKGIGFVPQEIDVMNELTVAENIFVGNLSSKGFFVDLNKTIERASAFLEGLKINLDPKEKVRTLSIGKKQLLMIARALSKNPGVLILDEPTTALTNDDVENLYRIIKGLKDRGTGIVFVTHKLDEIFNCTDRVTILRDGRYISTYSRVEYDEKKIITDMVGRKINNIYPKRESNIGDTILTVKDITVEHPRIKGRNLISDISFELRKGEVLGIAGLVGSGRTEVLSALYGIYKKSKGTIRINNIERSIESPKDALKYGISIVTEDRKYDGLLMQNNIRKNISISNIKSICRKVFLRERLEKDSAGVFFKDLNIKAPSIESMVVSLSGGNQQKVVIARALNNKPVVLLLDEPTKGIDVGAKFEIYALINKLTEEGISIILVSSELPELIGMSDRILVMSKGSIVGECNDEEICQEKIMEFSTSSKRNAVTDSQVCF